MTLTIAKSKRKVSCLPCRERKVKCDGGQQPCQRCIKRKTTDRCTYLTPGQVGRRPKNAVWNKLVLNLSSQTNTGNCREFIFENVCYAMPVDAVFIDNDSTKNLFYFISNLFNYAEPIMQIAISRVNKSIPYLPDVKMYNLLDFFTVSTIEILNVLANRFSALPMDNFRFYETISASIVQDLAFKYFSEPPPTIPSSNPLSTLSPYQAIHMIDTFFTVSPHSLMLNRTLITQGYWTDSMDPLLLCVVYGIATYMEKMLNGRPLALWDADDELSRNPFLEYAYILVQKSSSEVSLAKYQAVTILGLFNMVHGMVKRGFACLGLAYMIGFNLGTSDGTFQEKSNDIQAELATYTFWSTFNGNCRGVVDLGQVPHYTDKSINQKLPPPNVQQSVSYQFEKSSGDIRRYPSFDYLVESFYVHSVSCRLTVKLLLQFPEVRHNMFYPRLKKSKADMRRVGYPKPDDLQERMQKVLDDFGVFLEETKHTLSTSQIYQLEMVQALYDLHLIFLKHIGPVIDGVNYGNSSYDIFQNIQLLPNDPTTMAKILVALPKVYRMMDKTQEFLSNPANYENSVTFLPRGLIISVLESVMETLFIQLAGDPWDESSFEYLKMVEKISQQRDIWSDWTAISSVQDKLVKYFTEGISSIVDSTTLPASGITVLDVNDPSASPPSITSTDDYNDLAYAAFFDPCGTWLNPMRNSLVDLQLLSVASESVSPESTPPNTTSIDYNIINNNNISMVHPSPAPSMDHSTDLMTTTSFVTELDDCNNNINTQPNYLSSWQEPLSNGLAKCHLDQSNELFLPIHYPTPSDDQHF